jgi:hypothetical protein
MPSQSFSLANLTDVGLALYGLGWQRHMARALNMPLISVTQWCHGGPLPDIRKPLANLCRLHDMGDLARKLEKLGPPE